MRYILVALLVILFGYSLALVLQNPTELPVDLLFTQVMLCDWACYSY